MAKKVSKIPVQAATSSRTHSLQVGKSVFVRTVTQYYTGKLLSVTDTDIVLGEAAWIANTGRFSNCLKTGTLDEVEPYPDEVIINRDGIIDICVWNHPLPREVK